MNSVEPGRQVVLHIFLFTPVKRNESVALMWDKMARRHIDSGKYLNSFRMCHLLDAEDSGRTPSRCSCPSLCLQARTGTSPQPLATLSSCDRCMLGTWHIHSQRIGRICRQKRRWPGWGGPSSTAKMRWCKVKSSTCGGISDCIRLFYMKVLQVKELAWLLTLCPSFLNNFLSCL